MTLAHWKGGIMHGQVTIFSDKLFTGRMKDGNKVGLW
jgi:hypothetical protein